MLLRTGLLCAMTWAAAAALAQNEIPEPVGEAPRSVVQKASFLFGYQLIQDSRRAGADLDIEQVIAGLRAAAADEPHGMSSEEVESVMVAFEQLLMRRFEESAERNRVEGQSYLERFAREEGVQRTDSGVYYKVLTRGSGTQSPSAQDRVRVHYHGTSVDGRVFDSTRQREPAVFAVAGTIRGMSEILQRMKTGDRWQIVIPSNLAYGAQGSPPVIGPNQVLVFEVELVEILK